MNLLPNLQPTCNLFASWLQHGILVLRILGFSIGLPMSAETLQQPGITGDGDHRFRGLVGIVGEMPGKIICAELFAGVFAISVQIAYPFLQEAHRLPGERFVRAEEDRGVHHDDHVSALFDRHLVSAGIQERISGIGINA